MNEIHDLLRHDIPLKEAPLRLPRFVFLQGPFEAAKPLATAIADSTPDVGIFDFEAPLRDATLALFFPEHNPSSLDLTDVEVRRRTLPFDGDISVGEWLGALSTHLENSFSGHHSVRARMALNASFGPEGQMYETLLFRDATSADIREIAGEIAGANLLTIHHGPLGQDIVSGVRHIWLPEPSLDSQMKALRRELNP